MCILHAVKVQQAEIREKSGAKLSLSPGEKQGLITDELLESASHLDNTAWINRLSTLTARPDDFSPAPGANYTDNDCVTLHGFDDSSQDSPFAAQLLRLISGEHISPGNRNMVIVHRSMIEANGLELGGDDNWEEAFLYMKEPELLDQTKATLETLASGLTVSEQNALFKRIQISLEQTEKTVTLILILTIGTAAISITLLLCMWMRGRIKEFAVFMSMGENLFLVIAQVVFRLGA